MARRLLQALQTYTARTKLLPLRRSKPTQSTQKHVTHYKAHVPATHTLGKKIWWRSFFTSSFASSTDSHGHSHGPDAHGHSHGPANTQGGHSHGESKGHDDALAKHHDAHGSDLDTTLLITEWKLKKEERLAGSLEQLNEINMQLTGLEEWELAHEDQGWSMFHAPLMLKGHHFGTLDNPVLVPSAHKERIVGCVGGPDELAHEVLWHNLREDKPDLICLECGQVFARVSYEEWNQWVEEQVEKGIDKDELFDPM